MALGTRTVRLARGVGLCSLGLVAICAFTVRLREDDGALRFEGADHGRGFDTATTTKGSGLTNMTDGVDGLGGEVEVTSAAGRGTQLHGSLPVVAVGMPA